MVPHTATILVALLAVNFFILGFLWYVHRDLKDDSRQLRTGLKGDIVSLDRRFAVGRATAEPTSTNEPTPAAEGSA